jgi:hypothetical protein
VAEVRAAWGLVQALPLPEVTVAVEQKTDGGVMVFRMGDASV